MAQPNSSWTAKKRKKKHIRSPSAPTQLPKIGKTKRKKKKKKSRNSFRRTYSLKPKTKYDKYKKVKIAPNAKAAKKLGPVDIGKSKYKGTAKHFANPKGIFLEDKIHQHARSSSFSIRKKNNPVQKNPSIEDIGTPNDWKKPSYFDIENDKMIQDLNNPIDWLQDIKPRHVRDKSLDQLKDVKIPKGLPVTQIDAPFSWTPIDYSLSGNSADFLEEKLWYESSRIQIDSELSHLMAVLPPHKLLLIDDMPPPTGYESKLNYLNKLKRIAFAEFRLQQNESLLTVPLGLLNEYDSDDDGSQFSGISDLADKIEKDFDKQMEDALAAVLGMDADDEKDDKKDKNIKFKDKKQKQKLKQKHVHGIINIYDDIKDNLSDNDDAISPITTQKSLQDLFKMVSPKNKKKAMINDIKLDNYNTLNGNHKKNGLMHMNMPILNDDDIDKQMDYNKQNDNKKKNNDFQFKSYKSHDNDVITTQKSLQDLFKMISPKNKKKGIINDIKLDNYNALNGNHKKNGLIHINMPILHDDDIDKQIDKDLLAMHYSNKKKRKKVKNINYNDGNKHNDNKKKKKHFRSKSHKSHKSVGLTVNDKENIDINSPSPSPPVSFICPLGINIISDAVMAADGNVYDRCNIEKWFATNNKSPNGRKIRHKKLMAMDALTKRITKWKIKNKLIKKKKKKNLN